MSQAEETSLEILRVTRFLYQALLQQNPYPRHFLKHFTNVHSHCSHNPATSTLKQVLLLTLHFQRGARPRGVCDSHNIMLSSARARISTQAARLQKARVHVRTHTYVSVTHRPFEILCSTKLNSLRPRWRVSHPATEQAPSKHHYIKGCSVAGSRLFSHRIPH